MGGWNSKGKPAVESSNSISVFWLKEHDYLNKDYSRRSGGIKWTRGCDDENSIGFSVIKDNLGKPEENTYINLKYTNTKRDSGEKEYMDYRVEMTTTHCRYGGKRYWFICPLTKNGEYCGRRVGVLLHIGKWFGCRHCGNFTYSTQKLSSRYNGFVSIPDIDRAEEKVKQYYYRGKPTRKYRRVIELTEKFEMGLIEASTLLGIANKK